MTVAAITEIAVAFAGLLLAGMMLLVTVVARDRGLRVAALSVGVLFLLLQGGCCVVLTRLDKGLGGTGRSLLNTVSIAGAIGFVLVAVAILGRGRR